MEGAYRRRPDWPATFPRRDELAWRRRLRQGARGVLVAFGVPIAVAPVLMLVLLVVGDSKAFVTSLGFVLPALAYHVAIIAIAWRFTAKPPHGASHRLERWRRMVRVLVVAEGVLYVLRSLHIVLPSLEQLSERIAKSVLVELTPVASVVWFLYVGALLEALGATKRGESMRRAGAIYVVAGLAWWLLSLSLRENTAPFTAWQAAMFAVPSGAVMVVLLWFLVQLWDLTRALQVARHEWWLNKQALPQVEWASVVHYGTGAADVATVDGERRSFANANDAHHWLEGEDYVFVQDDKELTAPPELEAAHSTSAS